jgi:2-oxoglutarate dehydrogenase complex dehydrogenase (E1) component-like enzyme
MALHLPEQLADGRQLRRVSRDAAASPATGSHSVHDREQEEVVVDAFSGLHD